MEKKEIKKDVFMMSLFKVLQKPASILKLSYLLYLIVFIQMIAILFGLLNIVYMAIYGWKNI